MPGWEHDSRVLDGKRLALVRSSGSVPGFLATVAEQVVARQRGAIQTVGGGPQSAWALIRTSIAGHCES